MKNIRLIPILLVLPLLSSCGAGGNPPSFSKEGVEVDFEDFQDQLELASEESELNMDVPLQDRITKGSYYSLNRNVQKRGGNEIYRSETISNSKAEFQLDFDNLVGKYVYEGKDVNKLVRPSDTSNSDYTYKDTIYYQFNKISRVDYFVTASVNQKNYSTNNVSISRDYHFNDFAASMIQWQLMNFNEYKPSYEIDADGYLFYVNGETLFTYETSNERTEDIVNYDSSYGTKNIRSKIKCQLDLTDRKQAVRISYEVTTEYTYQKDYYGMSDRDYLAGDVVTNEERVYTDYYVDAQKVNVNPIDIDNYYHV